MGSRLALVFALFLGSTAPAHAASAKLFHDSFDASYRAPFGAAPAGSRVTLRLRVTDAKPASVAVHVEKRFVTMRRRGTLWSAAVALPRTPAIVHYDFRVRLGRRTLWYGDDGDTDVVRGGTGITTSTEQVPYTITAYDPSFKTPAWSQGAVVYSIFPDRFRNGDRTNDYCRAGSTTACPVFYGNTPAKAHATWNEPVETPPPFNRDFFGGDLEGITEKLPYLRTLGIDAIWLNPIFTARSNHRYDTDNYLQVDPALGGDGAYAALVAAARDAGIRLILDGVFNHASSDSLYFDRFHRYPTEGACESTSSPYRGWFRITGGTPCSASDYVGWANNDTLPVFQHDNAAVKDFLFRGNDGVAKHWLRSGAAGWRLDAAQEIDHAWWREFRSAVKPDFADAPLIGEVTAGPADAGDYLLGNEFDGVMNYRFRAAALGFAATRQFSDSNGAGAVLTPSKLGHALTAMWEEYPQQASRTSFDLIDSHDTVRALNVLAQSGSLDEARERMRLATLLQFTWVGAPMVLWGDEVGINAPGGDPFNRAPYPWPDETGNLATYGPPLDTVAATFSQLAGLRDTLTSLRDGSFQTLLAGDRTSAAGDNDVYAFARAAAPAKPVIVALNKSANSEIVTIPVRNLYPNGTQLVDQLLGIDASVTGGSIRATVPGRSGLVLVSR
jgi:glycosidase